MIYSRYAHCYCSLFGLKLRDIETVSDSKWKAQVRSRSRSEYVLATILAPFDTNVEEEELYKAAKIESDGDVKSKGKAPMVEDEEDDGEAGPELPPDFDQEDEPDDEEGRFFGGGMERQTAEAMQYIDHQDAEEGQEAVRVAETAYVGRAMSQLLTSI